MYFLTNNPAFNPEASEFVSEMLCKHHSDNLTVTVVKEEDAASFAYSVKEEMEKA